MWKPLTLAAALAVAGPALAQTPAAPAAAPAASSSAAKKELVAKILKLQQPGIEAMARQLAEQPARQMLGQIERALQNIPADRREAVARDIEADARKYIDEATPIVRDRAIRLAPTTIGPIIEERFTEDELKQIIAILESPVNRRFQMAAPDMQKAIGEKLVADSRAEVEVKLKAFDQSVAKRLGITPPPAGAASGAKPAGPAKK
jgi:uncharacterized protein